MIFENAFNISIKQLDLKYGIHTFLKTGDFLILKRRNKLCE